MANRVQSKLPFVKGQYGENWRKLRERTGMTVREFAKSINYTYSKISKIENELEFPTIEQINIYQDKFNVSFDYLIGITTTTDIEKNKITRYTGLSEKAIDKLHNIFEEENSINPDDELLLCDNSFKTSWKTELYNSLICNSSFDGFVYGLNKYQEVTGYLSERISEIESFDELIDGYIRGLIMKAALSEMSLRNSIERIIDDFDKRKSNGFEKAWNILHSELENKCGIAEGADEEDIEIAKKHLKGQLAIHEYGSQTAMNTLEVLMRVDVDDEDIE